MNDFTIIVPHYNCAEKLIRLLKSIGVHKNMQVIIIDDNSDAVNTLLLEEAKLKFPYVEVYKNTTLKRSAGRCRNIGIDHANGQWTIFADADDYFTDDYYMFISKYIKCDADMIMFPPRVVSGETGKEVELSTYLGYVDKYLRNRDICAELGLRYKTSTVWSRMISTKKIKDYNVKCDETIVANDVCFATKVSYYCKNLIVDENVIYCYTKSPKTLTTTINTERYDIRVQVFINYYKFLKANLLPEEFKLLYLNAFGILLDAVLNGLGIKYVFRLWIRMKKNNIKVLDIRIFNIPFVVRKILGVLGDRRRMENAYMGKK